MNRPSLEPGVRECVRQLALRYGGAVPVVERLGGREHLVFRLRFPSGSKVLKLATAASCPSLYRELYVLRFLQGCGFPVPRVESADEGAALGRPFLLMADAGEETVAQRVRQDGPLARRLFADMGCLLGRLHAVAPPRSGEAPLGPLDSQAQTHALSAVAEQSVAGGVLDARDVARFQSLPIPEVAGTQLCHGDFHALQCLVRDGRIVAVTDWGSAWVGNAAIDLAVAHGYLDFYGRDDLRAEFFAGYASAGTVPADYEAISVAVRMAHMLHLLRARGERATDPLLSRPVVERAAALFRAYANAAH